ncbi:molybdopterin-dependent oxidoreductase [Trichlorobacter ammonificans]|uniref:NADPH-Fe(3+) oxidoreductase subunit alpha n=1 Tax=Trichlorobacter ammonificans TaxID=2916410 RepID=A0ABM9D449_9BACT|nr:molybdopterin-dependent oxidoreductase [Trichlorobacter ammonificans]CAH2030020.1 NADPH-Fe(3+) oxidoreductase subunit alpha [Trichlorobacter ammonificans]
MAHTECCDTNTTITLTIDGSEVQVPAGTTILDAARKLGISIPTLCWLEKISTTGACRVCAVEVEGVARPMTACNTPVKEGIKVTTQSPELEKIRRKTMELMLVNHPLDCPICDAGGECDLQDACYALGASRQEYAADLERLPIRYDWRLLESDPNRCILCEKCVKVCREITGVAAIETQSRGDRAVVETVSGKPLDCDFCGNCIAACPTGTLISKPFKFMGRPWAFEVKESICAFCSTGCQIEYHVKDGTVARVTSRDSGYNSGNLCINGRFGYGAFNAPQRLTAPTLLDADGARKPATWDVALATAVSAIKQVITTHGAAAVAGIASPRATNEENYLFAKLIREAVGSPNLDSEARLGYAPAQAIQERMLGVSGATATMDTLEQAGCIIVLGSDLKAESAGFGYRAIKAATKHDAKLVIASARPTSLDGFANSTLRYKAGSEGFVALGLAKALLAAGRQVQATGLDSFCQSVAAVTSDQITMATGLTEADFNDAVSFVKGPVAVIYGHEFMRSTDATAAVTGAVNLAILTGASLFPIDEKNNTQGLLDAGVAPAAGGRDLPGIIDAIEKGDLRALLVMGSDLLHILPNRARVEAALKKLECLVVLDLFPTATARYAHVLLPAATAAEKSGTFTTVDRRVQAFTAAASPAGESRPDLVILGDLYARLTGGAAPSLAALRQEMNQLAARPAPVATPALVPVTPVASSTASTTLLLAPVIRHNGSYSSWSANNRLVAGEAVALLSAADAGRIGVVDGNVVTISANGGSVTLPVQVLPAMPAGLIVAPSHFPEAELNRLFITPAATLAVTVAKS